MPGAHPVQALHRAHPRTRPDQRPTPSPRLRTRPRQAPPPLPPTHEQWRNLHLPKVPTASHRRSNNAPRTRRPTPPLDRTRARTLQPHRSRTQEPPARTNATLTTPRGGATHTRRAVLDRRGCRFLARHSSCFRDVPDLMRKTPHGWQSAGVVTDSWKESIWMMVRVPQPIVQSAHL